MLLVNNIGYWLAGAAPDFDFPDVDPANGWADVNPASRRNLSSDASATGHNLTPGGPVSGARPYVNFPVGDLPPHLPSDPIDGGADLSSLIPAVDIDGQLARAGAAWDIGADEFGGDDGGEAAVVRGACRATRRWCSSGGRRRSSTTWASTSTAASSADGPWTRLDVVADSRASARRRWARRTRSATRAS